MNPTYKVGDVVQIISEEEVRSHPADVCGDFILTHFLSGADDLFQREKLLICGCSAVITGISETSAENLYKLTPLFTKDKSVFPWDDWLFSAAEFRHHIVSPLPVPSMSFDDLLKGATSQLANLQA